MRRTDPFHDGERAAQERAGVRATAEQMTSLIGATVPPVAATFLAARSFVVIGAAGADGSVWAGLLRGEPGFAHATGSSTIQVAAVPPPGDPLRAALRVPTPVGLLGIDTVRRRRIRVNGQARPVAAGLEIRTEQVFANCGRHITVRPTLDPSTAAGRTPAARAAGLSAAQQRQLSTADTFFVATRSADGAVDVSHRGGEPGFVRVDGANRLSWVELSGNSMLMTLGNLQQEPSAGLLVVDWATGGTLQLAGTAVIDWDTRRMTFDLTDVAASDEGRRAA